MTVVRRANDFGMWLPARKSPECPGTNTLFGGRFTSMLNSELRIRTGLSYSASSHFDKLQQPGHWALTSFTDHLVAQTQEEWL